MLPNLHDHSTWPDYPFVAVIGRYTKGTAISLKLGEQVRHVIVGPLRELQQRYRDGIQTLQNMVDTIPGQEFRTTADLEAHWRATEPK